MKVFSFSPEGEIGGLKILAQSYTRDLSSLAGVWSLTLESGELPFGVGDTITLAGMAGGLVTSCARGSNGEWLVSGKDAGILLQKNVPAIDDIAEGGSLAVITALAGLCGLSVVGSGGLTGFNARSLITANTCAEAIQELCLLSGKIAYIDNAGRLAVVSPGAAVPEYDTILSGGGESLNLDGYATGATVIVQRRRESDAQSAGGVKTVWRGSTPSGFLSTESFSGSEVLENGAFSYEAEIYEPLSIPKRVAYTIQTGSMTKIHEALYEYDTDSFTEIRGDQEYRIFEWALLSEHLTTTVTGSFPASDGTVISLEETITKTTIREYDFDGRIVSEIEESITTRSATGSGGMTVPAAPPFDYRIERRYSYSIFDDSRVMTEVERRYEKKALSRLVPVIDANTNQYLTLTMENGERYILLPQSEYDDWVLVETTRTVHEIIENGECVVRASAEHTDNGAAYLLEHGYTLPDDLEDPTAGDAEKAFIALSTRAGYSEVEILPGGSSLGGDRQRVELPGRKKVFVAREGGLEGMDSWYWDGQYVPSKMCPHYSSGSCGIADIEVIGGSLSGTRCPYRGLNWTGCERAAAALERARGEEENLKLLETPVICTAGSGEVWISREIYIDDIISEEEAETIGNEIAANILTAKGGTRGICRTVNIPLDETIHPDGVITSATHDWKTLQTSVTYRTDKPVPAILIPDTVSSAAALVADREMTRRQRGYVGRVLTIGDDDVITVMVANRAIRCTTRLRYVAVNDTVLISMPGGSRGFGMVVERL
jgi:hypothetical protein